MKYSLTYTSRRSKAYEIESIRKFISGYLCNRVAKRILNNKLEEFDIQASVESDGTVRLTNLMGQYEYILPRGWNLERYTMYLHSFFDLDQEELEEGVESLLDLVNGIWYIPL